MDNTKEELERRNNALRIVLKKPFVRITKIHHYIVKGTYYGYPDCCIQEFITNSNTMATRQKTKQKEVKRRVSKHSGFMPCYYHSCKILKNELKLEDLIRNRICDKPFPGIDVLCYISSFTTR